MMTVFFDAGTSDDLTMDAVKAIRSVCGKQMLDGLNSADLSDLNLEGISNRLKATAETAKHYQNFSGISDEMDGQVRFIYRSDEIKSNKKPHGGRN